MLYITRQNEAYYYTAQPVGEVFYDLYNFSSMVRTEEAVQVIINWNIQLFKLVGTHGKTQDRYTLVLDFLSNMRTDNISPVIERLVKYFSAEGFSSSVNENPLRVIVQNLKLEDAINIIQDNNFQSLNNAVSSLNSSVWRLQIQN